MSEEGGDLWQKPEVKVVEGGGDEERKEAAGGQVRWQICMTGTCSVHRHLAMGYVARHGGDQRASGQIIRSCGGW